MENTGFPEKRQVKPSKGFKPLEGLGIKDTSPKAPSSPPEAFGLLF